MKIEVEVESRAREGLIQILEQNLQYLGSNLDVARDEQANAAIKFESAKGRAETLRAKVRGIEAILKALKEGVFYERKEK